MHLCTIIVGPFLKSGCTNGEQVINLNVKEDHSLIFSLLLPSS